MRDDYKVGYGKPPTKSKFQKGKSGNPSGRPKRKYRPEEPLDFQKELIAELKSPMTINEAGNKKTVPKLQALVKAVVACSFHDKAMMKYLLNWIKKFPKDAFVDDGSYTFRATRSQMDLMDAVLQEGAEWLADFNNATNSGTDLNSKTDAS
jgi:hypothetical protein